MLSSGAPLSEWLAWLETLSPKEIDLGLDRVQQILGHLDIGRPQHVLLVAGTNGKGSSVAMSAALLLAAGLRVGAYTSPHVHRYNERVVVDGKQVSDAALIGAFEKIEAVRGDTPLTYFEFGTLAAAVVFAASDLDVWILEVGLGGRLDATNAIDPTASLITNVALDHCDWLGDDVETIAVEKAGVMRTGRPVVFGDSEVPDAVIQRARKINAELLLRGRDFDVQELKSGDWNWRGPSKSFVALRPPGLLGNFQLNNAAAVLAVLDAAGLMSGIDENLVNRVLPELSLSGRSEQFLIDRTEWLVDVAHNPAAAEALAQTLSTLDARESTTAIVGVLDDKDTAGIITPLMPHVNRWIAITADSRRAVPANELARRLANHTGEACLVAASVAEAIEIARRNASENDRILVTGSFFTVGPVLDQLAGESRHET